MKMPKPIKGFDAVAFKHSSALRIYRKIKDMTPAEELEFWRTAMPIGQPKAAILRRPKAAV